MMKTIEPPQSINSEKAVLGALILDNSTINTVTPILEVDDFYSTSHSLIYKAITTLDQKQQPVDLTTLESQLQSSRDLEKVGGMDYIVELSSQVPTTTNATHYATIVRRKSRMRKVIQAAQDIVSEANSPFNEDMSEEEFFDWAGNIIYQALQEDVSSSFKNIDKEIDSFFSKMSKYQENPELMAGVSTGYIDLDKIIGGLKRGDLMILAARPSMGKTSLALNIAENVIGQDIPTLLFSLEMNSEQLTTRLLASAGSVDLHKLKNFLNSGGKGSVGHDLLKKMVNGANKLHKKPLLMDDTPGVNIATVRAKARQWRSNRTYFPREEPDKIGLILIDYLQLMHGKSGKNTNREQEVSDISRGLKALAREVNVPVIVLSQLNREVEKQKDKKPLLSHLRESGSIEQDADIILFLHRPEYYFRDKEELKGRAELIIAKHRNGPTGSVDLRFIHEYTKFENAGGFRDQEDYGDFEEYVPDDEDQPF
ncbi:MAG: replicative DNA helicase [Myxococcota bacterium]